MKHFDFVEIGTSDFDTCVASCGDNAVGLCVEPLQGYLDLLPNKRHVLKLAAAVSDRDGKATMFWVRPEDIAAHGLPAWLKGCNSLGEPHPTTARTLAERRLEHLMQATTVPVVSVRSLVAAHSVGIVDLLKVDTEGHDAVIVSAFAECVADGTLPPPRRIKFESNSLVDSAAVDAVVRTLEGLGYRVDSRGEDTQLTYGFAVPGAVWVAGLWLGVPGGGGNAPGGGFAAAERALTQTPAAVAADTSGAQHDEAEALAAPPMVRAPGPSDGTLWRTAAAFRAFVDAATVLLPGVDVAVPEGRAQHTGTTTEELACRVFAGDAVGINSRGMVRVLADLDKPLHTPAFRLGEGLLVLRPNPLEFAVRGCEVRGVVPGPGGALLPHAPAAAVRFPSAAAWLARRAGALALLAAHFVELQGVQLEAVDAVRPSVAGLPLLEAARLAAATPACVAFSSAGDFYGEGAVRAPFAVRTHTAAAALRAVFFKREYFEQRCIAAGPRVPRRVFAFWFGAPMSASREAAIESMRRVAGVAIVLVTEAQLPLWVVPGCPLPRGFSSLSATHKSDYLRPYFMHFHGGGYCDIKPQRGSWVPTFDAVDAGGPRVVGAGAAEGVRRVAMPLGTPPAEREAMLAAWVDLVGNGFYVFRPGTWFTAEWLRRANERMAAAADSLEAHPATGPTDTSPDCLARAGTPLPGYPFTWEGIGGEVLHPMMYHATRAVPGCVLRCLPQPSCVPGTYR